MSYDPTAPNAYNPNSLVWGSATVVPDRISGFWNPADSAAIAALTSNAGLGGDLTAGAATVNVVGSASYQFQTNVYSIPELALGAGSFSVEYLRDAQIVDMPNTTSVSVVVPYTYNDGCADQSVTITFTADISQLACGAMNDKSRLADHDGDGIADFCDADSDNDGIPDVIEDLNLNGLAEDDDNDGVFGPVAVLGDGVSSYLDLDSDNDSALDLFESGIPNSVITQTLDADLNGIIDLSVPVGLNGLADILETFPDSGVINYSLKNTDGDDKPDFVDLNSDGVNFDLYLLGNDAYDQLGAGFITPIVDADADGIMDQVDTDDVARGAPGSPLTTW